MWTSDNSGAYTINDVNQITNTGYTYDNNGNLTADPFRTYEWDAANRLVAINYPAIAGARTEFTYDGLSRRVKIVEKGLPTPPLSLTVQPANSSYGTYTTSSVSLSAGTYTLTIQGLNPNGADNTALVDAVKLNTTLVTNGGFETPVLANGTYQFNPTGATWTFSGTTGIARNSSAFTNNNPNAPEGKQVGIIQMTGSVSQPRTLTAGTYNLNLRAAQRGSGNASFQQIKASLQSTAVVVTSTKQFIWNGNSIVEERDASNNVLRRFYPQGEQISGGTYYYTRDHLGSVRELIDSTGAVRARYDYDPYGTRTKLSGDLESEFGYTGHYFHAQSGLNLALYRAYNSMVGRWLSRDPISEAGGLNLYVYVENDPLNVRDPLGLCYVGERRTTIVQQPQLAVPRITYLNRAGRLFRGGWFLTGIFDWYDCKQDEVCDYSPCPAPGQTVGENGVWRSEGSPYGCVRRPGGWL